MSGLLCVFAEGHCECSDSTDQGRLSDQATPSLRESVNTRAPQHSADQPRVTGKVDPELLLNTSTAGNSALSE